MQDEHWDANPDTEQIYDEVPADFTTYVRVNNSNQELEPGMRFSIVKDIGREAGLGKFRVFPLGSTNPDDEIVPSNAPDVIEEGMQLELRPYDKAGQWLECLLEEISLI